MNSGFYKNIDTNFEEACKLSSGNISHDDMISMLKTGNIPQKQISALNLDNVYNRDEAVILLSNLTGCDGKIREATAFKIHQLLQKDGEKSPLFLNIQPDIIANAAIDINGNICRLVADSVRILVSNKIFAQIFTSKILSFIDEAYIELDKFIFKDKKYTINKQLFKLYWCLENLKSITDYVSEEKLYKILLRASTEREYTIREKVAQIIVMLNSYIFIQIKDNLMHDENYYVRAVFS